MMDESQAIRGLCCALSALDMLKSFFFFFFSFSIFFFWSVLYLSATVAAASGVWEGTKKPPPTR
jgi:hypothetical protein